MPSGMPIPDFDQGYTNASRKKNPLGGIFPQTPSPYTSSPVGATSIGDVGPTQPGMSIGDYQGTGAAPGGGWNASKGLQAGIAGAGLLTSLFAPPGIDVKGPIKEAQTSARSLGSTSDTLTSQGSQALGPVLHYLSALQSGDPTAILQATMPERRRVIDQYDTAKQSTQFAPRGGGTSASLVGLETAKAKDLAEIGGKARTDAFKAAQDLGTELTKTGVQGKASSTNTLANLIEPIMRASAQDQQSVFGTFSNLASLAMLFL